jgi:hypothetical protein
MYVGEQLSMVVHLFGVPQEGKVEFSKANSYTAVSRCEDELNLTLTNP